MINIYSSKRFLFVAFVLLLAFSTLTSSVSAIRPLSHDGIVQDAYDVVYVKARSTMVYWLERLASGPSGGGGGH